MDLKRLRRLYGKYRHFILYAIIGASGVVLDFIFFAILTDVLFVNYLPANIISVSCGIINNFFLNAKFNYKIKEKLWFRFISFYCIGLAGMGLSTLLLFLLIDLATIPALWAKVMTIVVVTVIQFLLNNHISFRQKEKNAA